MLPNITKDMKTNWLFMLLTIGISTDQNGMCIMAHASSTRRLARKERWRYIMPNGNPVLGRFAWLSYRVQLAARMVQTRYRSPVISATIG